MGYTLKITVPDEVYHSLRTIGSERGRSPEQLALQWVEATARAYADDPLLRLAGIFESDVTDVSEDHDRYIGEGIAGHRGSQGDA